MKKGNTIVYEVDGNLYVNVTNRCSCNCEFCIRHNGDGAYGSDTLWLENEPSCEQIINEILKEDLTKYNELVFCGYGEPTYRLIECREAALEVKQINKAIKVRINTNGHSSLILGFDTAPLFRDAFDTVSISLNAPTKERYNEMCHPVYKEEAFSAMLDFAKNVKNYVHSVQFSIVRQSLSDEEIEECKKIADECGVKLKIREYIS